jgi:hypothetical protein
MERLQKGYVALKGFVVVILISLATYAVISGVRLAERYVAAVEMEKRYYIPGGESEFEFRVDRKEGTIQMWNGEKYDILR